MNKINKVSIITPLYNSEEFISETIESVLSQSYNNWEMIIVDDCSTDNGVNIVKKYQKECEKIKLIRLDNNSGAAVARNVAIKKAKGRFIAFLDSDDYWHPEKLKKQISFMSNNNYAFTFSYYQNVDINNKKGKIITAPEIVTYNTLLDSGVIGCLTAIYDIKKLGKIYMPLIRKRQDYALWLKILKRDIKAHCLDEVLAYYRKGNVSISSNKLSAAKYQWKIYREIEELSLLKSIYHFIKYFYLGTIKHYF
jgi:glycosyltransferase involved in cell wall biosynthesis